MWSLEILKAKNLKNYNKIPLEFLKKESSNLDHDQRAYKLLVEPFRYKNKIYYHIVLNTPKGLDFIKEKIDNVDQAIYVDEINLFIL